MTKIAGSESISQRHRSADSDLDSHQNVMDVLFVEIMSTVTYYVIMTNIVMDTFVVNFA
jgi:hypothetical protein